MAVRSEAVARAEAVCLLFPRLWFCSSMLICIVSVVPLWFDQRGSVLLGVVIGLLVIRVL